MVFLACRYLLPESKKLICPKSCRDVAVGWAIPWSRQLKCEILRLPRGRSRRKIAALRHLGFGGRGCFAQCYFHIRHRSRQGVCRFQLLHFNNHELRQCAPRTGGNLEANDDQSRLYLQKIANAVEKAFADRALLFDENKLLFKQNNEKAVSNSTRVSVVGRAKVMSYNDIIEAQRKRCEKQVRRSLHQQPSQIFRAPTARMLSIVGEEVLESEREIEAMGLTQYCHVLNLMIAISGVTKPCRAANIKPHIVKYYRKCPCPRNMTDSAPICLTSGNRSNHGLPHLASEEGIPLIRNSPSAKSRRLPAIQLADHSKELGSTLAT